MEKNLGTIDLIIRGILGLFVIYLGSLSYTTSTTLSILAFLIGFALILTSMFRRCPIYALLGASTRHSSSYDNSD